ncbi:MAG: type II toxin-antitoxin system VapC family toxin [Pyrinomonadaceae bacterium]
MAAGKRKIYWDACVFLAWLNNEPQIDISVTEGMEKVVKLVDANKVTLMTSVVTRTELLDNRMSAEVKTNFDSLFNRRNVVMITLDLRISDLSHEIRDYYDRQGIKLGTSDCQHLATAILYMADEFHTLDGSGKKKKGKLLPLNGIVAGKYKLRICQPNAEQDTLFPEIGS